MVETRIPREWSERIRRLGFAQESPVVLRRRSNDVLQAISIKKNLYEPSSQVLATVGIEDPYLGNETVTLLRAYVCPSALRFFSKDESWWPNSELLETLNPIANILLPWFDHFNTFSEILRLLEDSLSKGWAYQYLLEKRDTGAPPYNETYYHASLLHLKLGNKEASCRRAHDWLSFVTGLQDSSEPSRTLKQIADLDCGRIVAAKVPSRFVQ